MEFLLVTILLVCTILYVEQTCLDLNGNMKLEVDKRLNGYVYISIIVPQIYQCANLCYCEKLCKSFNYNIETGICERSNISSSSLVDEIGSMYVKSTSIPEAVGDVCRQHNCPRHQQCRPHNGISTCVPTVNCYTMIDGRGIYGGTISHTKSGYTCQRWDSNDFNEHFDYSNELSLFPTDASWDEAANYCRTPTDDPAGNYPWCYTTDSNMRWEYCDIPQC